MTKNCLVIPKYCMVITKDKFRLKLNNILFEKILLCNILNIAENFVFFAKN